MHSIMIAMGSVGEEKLSCAIMVQMKHLERRYSPFCCSISDIWSFVTSPPALTCICSNVIHYACLGSVDEEKLACAIMVQMKHLERRYSTFCCSICDIWSFVTPPPAFTCICGNASNMLAMGSMCQEKLACATKV